MVRETIIFALISSILRAFLNVVDRRVFGYLRQGVLKVNFLNAILPFILLLIGSFLMGLSSEVIPALLSIQAIIFALLTQLVAYAFSLAFKYVNVHQVVVYAKLPDVFIPLGIFLLSNSWDWLDYLFAILTVVACYPILRSNLQLEQKVPYYVIPFLIVSLTVNGSLSSILVDPSNLVIAQSTLFTMSVMFWRTVWSALGLFSKRVNLSLFTKLEIHPLILFRSILAVGTQVSLILSLAGGRAAIAWPILNTTILLAVVFSYFFLKEKMNQRELFAIVAIGILTITRFFI